MPRRSLRPGVIGVPYSVMIPYADMVRIKTLAMMTADTKSEIGREAIHREIVARWPKLTPSARAYAEEQCGPLPEEKLEFYERKAFFLVHVRKLAAGYGFTNTEWLDKLTSHVYSYPDREYSYDWIVPLSAHREAPEAEE